MAQRPPSGSPGARGSVRTYVGHSFGGIVRECSGGGRGAVDGRTGRHLGVNGRSDREMKFLPVPAHPGKGSVPPLPPGASRKPTGRRGGFPTRPGDGFRGPPEGVAPAPERCRAVGSGLALRAPPHIFRILVRNPAGRVFPEKRPRPGDNDPPPRIPASDGVPGFPGRGARVKSGKATASARPGTPIPLPPSRTTGGGGRRRGRRERSGGTGGVRRWIARAKSPSPSRPRAAAARSPVSRTAVRFPGSG